VKGLDFGISKHTYAPSMSVTRTGTVVGTPYYTSPEQIRGEQVDHRTDIYAFGVILYELLAGNVPFNANNFAELVVALMSATPLSLAELRQDVPAEFAAVVARAMLRDRQERYQTLPELIAALEPYALQSSMQASGLSAAGGGRLHVPPVWSISQPPSEASSSASSVRPSAASESQSALDPHAQSASRRVSRQPSGQALADADLDASEAPTLDVRRARQLSRGGWAFVLVLGACLVGVLGWKWFNSSKPTSPGGSAPDVVQVRESTVTPTPVAPKATGERAFATQTGQQAAAAQVEQPAATELPTPANLPATSAAPTRKAGHPLTRNARQGVRPQAEADGGKKELPPASSLSDVTSPALTPVKSHDPHNPLKSMQIK